MAGLRDLQIGRKVLPASLLSAKFARSGGPGGQNVNKVASKAEIRFDLAGAATYFDAETFERIRTRFANRLDANGFALVVASEHRDQPRNVEAALLRLEALLAQAMVRPKARRPTKPTAGSQRRRIEEKKRRSDVKKGRGAIRGES